jgi:uncharacterized protein DUF5681
MSEPSETEKVGYKQPPRRSQFKPGVSGNPRGRPKRKLDIGLALNQALNEKVVTEPGKTVTGMEALIQSIVDRVLRGESKAIPELMRLFNKVELFKHVPDPTRLTGVVVMPKGLLRDQAKGTDGGYYTVGNGWLYVDPVTKEIYSS